MGGDETTPRDDAEVGNADDTGREVLGSTPAVEAEDIGAVGALDTGQQQRLAAALRAAWAFPFLDDVEDFICEAVISYARGIHISDVLQDPRTKRLYDVVDAGTGAGWSIKALQLRNLAAGTVLEFVIQRADIIKKAAALGFPDGLTTASPEERLGLALVRHWNQKVETDGQAQGVKDGRIGILLKTLDRRRYVYFEEPIPLYRPDDLEWRWSKEGGAGLQGVRRTDGKVALKWYHGQKQLFQRLTIPVNAVRVEIEPTRLQPDVYVRETLRLLDV